MVREGQPIARTRPPGDTSRARHRGALAAGAWSWYAEGARDSLAMGEMDWPVGAILDAGAPPRTGQQRRYWVNRACVPILAALALAVLAFSRAAPSVAAEARGLPLIPWPKSVTIEGGSLRITRANCVGAREIAASRPEQGRLGCAAGRRQARGKEDAGGDGQSRTGAEESDVAGAEGENRKCRVTSRAAWS